jgi:hypothetical protein
VCTASLADGVPLPMICGATGPCIDVWQHWRAHAPQMWRCTKRSAGTLSRRSLTPAT